MAVSRNAFTDAQFSTHKAWMLTTQNSFMWPKKWRKAIFKVTTGFDVNTGHERIVVLPRNPEYQQYLDAVEARERKMGPIPPMHLEAAVFDSFEQLEQWIDILERMN